MAVVVAGEAIVFQSAIAAIAFGAAAGFIFVGAVILVGLLLYLLFSDCEHCSLRCFFYCR